MKRKALALILCLAVILTVALPGTLAVSMDTQTTTSTVTLGSKSKTDPQPTTEPPATTEIAENTPQTPANQAESTNEPTTQPTVPETTVPETTVPETSAPQCTCATTDGNHAEGCELYVEPEEAEPFDPQKAYDQLMACETYQQMDEITGKFTDENWDMFTQEMIDGIFSRYARLTPSQPLAPIYGDHAPNFSSAGPLIRDTGSTTKSRIATYSARSLARDADSTSGGLQLKKTAIVNTDNTYTITLEAFATGQEITTYVKDGVDIVLMLDLSGYMYGSSYTQASSMNYSTLYSNYNDGQVYYYHDGSQYRQIQVTRSNGSRYAIAYADDSQSITGQTNKQGTDNVNIILYQRTTNTSDLSKLVALKTAVNGFIDKVHEEAPSSRIAIVSYGDDSHVLSGSMVATDAALVTVNDEGQTALKTIVNNLNILGGKSNSHLAAADAVKIFQAVPATSQEYQRQRVSVLFSAGVPGDGWTTKKNSNTDGTGGTGGKDIAQATMHLANVLKTTKGGTVVLSTGSNFDGGARWDTEHMQTLLGDTGSVEIGCGSTFYCVGLDIPTSGDPRNSSVRLWESPYKDGALANEYFWRISSHRPDGSHITSASDLGSQGPSWLSQGVYNQDYQYHNSLYYFYPDGLTRNQPNGYYLTTESGSGLGELTRIFDSIAGQATTTTGTSTTLGTSAVVKDIIAPEFKLPEGAKTDDITISSYKFTRMNGEEYVFSTTTTDTNATATVDTNGIVSVTGFNFSEQWCGMSKAQNGQETAHGSKLVITFNVVTKPGFLGGNNVFTNTSAGVYTDSNATTPVQEFERPQVNVQIPDVTVNPAEKNVYLLGSLTGDQIKSGAKANCGDAELNLDPTATNYGLETWQNAYVNIAVSYQDASGNTITELSGLENDTTYKVLVTVSPKEEALATSSGAKATAKTGEGTGDINVFKPELTFQDSTVYYGDTAPTGYDGNLTKTEWKHNGTLYTVTMIGNAPTLSLSYTPGTGIVDGKVATKNDIPVDVTVTIGTTDVTGYTTFVHTKCSTNETAPTDGKFWLHVKTCSLTVKKQAADGTTIGNDEYFVFNIKKDGVAYTQVTIRGTGYVTITQLPVGTYTVEEDTATAWRYESSMSPNSATLSKSITSATVTCTNTIKNDKWLNHFAQVINTFGDKQN